MMIHGWGRYPRREATVHQPATARRLRSLVAEHDGPLIARGMGRSYGDSALGTTVLDLRQLDWLRSFDPRTGVLECDAGVTLDTLLSVFAPRGWFLPVTPGTRFVTVGGAIASDVHGKNHHHVGCFSAFVQSLDLLLGDGSTLQCSPELHHDLFRATCGGMGLTGVILSARLRLRAIPGEQIDQTVCKAQNLAQLMALFDTYHDTTYSVAWIDCLSTGKSMGRGLLSLGEHSPGAGKPPPASLPVPFSTPGFLLNPYSMRAFNSLYYAQQRQSRQQSQVHYRPFFYPLDRITHWNRLYGKQGFVQYQCVIPRAASATALDQLLRRIAASGRGSFLAVLKAFGPANDNFLSFPIPGYTLALDFKMSAGLLPLLDELDAIVLHHGGRLYLTKDARMSAATFRRSYPRWEAFQTVRARYGALGRFESAQSRRLGLAG